MSIKRHDDPGNEWKTIGPTPIAAARLPRGVLRWKVEKAGFQPLEFLNGGLQPFRYPPEGDPLNFAPHVAVPVLMLNGASDSTFPVPTQKRLFELLGTPASHKRHIIYPGGHGVFAVRRSEMIREMLDWLDRYLGPVKR